MNNYRDTYFTSRSKLSTTRGCTSRDLSRSPNEGAVRACEIAARIVLYIISDDRDASRNARRVCVSERVTVVIPPNRTRCVALPNCSWQLGIWRKKGKTLKTRYRMSEERYP